MCGQVESQGALSLRSAICANTLSTTFPIAPNHWTGETFTLVGGGQTERLHFSVSLSYHPKNEWGVVEGGWRELRWGEGWGKQWLSLNCPPPTPTLPLEAKLHSGTPPQIGWHILHYPSSPPPPIHSAPLYHLPIGYPVFPDL
uniref:Uncharacterized protein n=1 Tax=Trieres chinensis TaxID=1514140 RepID=A0A7S2AAJ9_TRICV